MQVKNISGKTLAVGRYFLGINETSDLTLDDRTFDYAVNNGLIQVVGEERVSNIGTMKKTELVKLCDKLGLDYSDKKVSELRVILSEELSRIDHS